MESVITSVQRVISDQPKKIIVQHYFVLRYLWTVVQDGHNPNTARSPDLFVTAFATDTYTGV